MSTVSYSEAQLWELMDQVEAMPYGPGHIALVERIIAHADALNLPKLGFVARTEALRGYRQMGEPTKALVAFAWLVAEFDRNPTAYADRYPDLLWDFKFAVGALTRSPEVPLDRTYAVLDDMQRRWIETGHSLHAVYSHRHRVARHIGDFDTAAKYYELWCAAPRDDLSDCAGCDPEMKAYWLALIGRDEEAVAIGANVLSGEWTCSEQPQSMLTTLMVPYVRTGRLDEARDAHRRAYRLHRPNIADLAEIGEHIAFCARTGNEARAIEIVERHLGWLDRAPSPWDTMIFSASSAHALRRAQARRPDEELTVFRPGAEGREGTRLTATELADQLEAQAVQIADRFDRRNGTDRVGTQVRDMLNAEPLIDYLPLSPTATPAGSSADNTRSSTVVDLFAKNAPAHTGAAGSTGGSEARVVRSLSYDEAVELAGSDRAGEAIAVLTEAVADRTASGDAAGAADARHALAIAYLNTGRPLDAAEVAEEELAYRLRTEPGPDQPSPAIAARRLLTAIYLRLGQPDEALAQIDAVAADCLRVGNHTGAGQMHEEAGDILDQLDRDQEAAARYLAAAHQFAAAGRPFEELRNRRQHAFSLTYVHGPEQGLSALAEAAALLDRLPGGDASDEARWERAKHTFDEAHLRWRAEQPAVAADLAQHAAEIWQTIGERRGASEAQYLRARALLDADRPAEAEQSIRQGLATLPAPERRQAFVSVLDAALRAQGRDAAAQACWAEYGETKPD
jgi:tetratricopeptide (TPR) repeat protein